MSLPEFEEQPVRRARHKLLGTGDGLSKSHAADPVAYRQGDRITFAVEAVCDDVGHPRIHEKDGDTEDLERVHVWRAETMTPVDSKTVAKSITAQKVANQKMRDEQEGVSQLDLDGDPDLGD